MIVRLFTLSVWLFAPVFYPCVGDDAGASEPAPSPARRPRHKGERARRSYIHFFQRK